MRLNTRSEGTFLIAERRLFKFSRRRGGPCHDFPKVAFSVFLPDLMSRYQVFPVRPSSFSHISHPSLGLLLTVKEDVGSAHSLSRLTMWMCWFFVTRVFLQVLQLFQWPALGGYRVILLPDYGEFRPSSCYQLEVPALASF